MRKRLRTAYWDVQISIRVRTIHHTIKFEARNEHLEIDATTTFLLERKSLKVEVARNTEMVTAPVSSSGRLVLMSTLCKAGIGYVGLEAWTDPWNALRIHFPFRVLGFENDKTLFGMKRKITA